MRSPMDARFANQIKIAACAVVLGTGIVHDNEVQAAQRSQAVSSVNAYCNASWRNAGIPVHEWQDCTQETFAELLGRIPTDRLHEAVTDKTADSRRELNRSVWCVAQRYRRRHVTKPLVNPDIADSTENSAGEANPAEELRELIDSPDNCLSQLQRNVLHHLADGNSVAETSELLGLPAHRISNEKYRAIQSLRAVAAG